MRVSGHQRGDTWETVAPYPVPIGWQSCGAVAGRIICAGGLSNSQPVTASYSYDPVTAAWSSLPAANSPGFRPGSACGFYRVGGSSVAGFQPTTTVELLPGFDRCGSAQDTAWLTVDPATATIAPGEQVTVMLTLTAEVAQPGTYTSSVAVFEDTPYAVDAVPVTMTVTPQPGHDDRGQGRLHAADPPDPDHRRWRAGRGLGAASGVWPVGGSVGDQLTRW